jgi:hypothetical protein
MKIGDIVRVGEREIPMPSFKPQAPKAPEPAPSQPAPERESEPKQPERVP